MVSHQHQAKATLPSSKPRLFLLARHGQTNYNAEHRVQGTLDEGVVLTDEGIAQASALGEYAASRRGRRLERERDGENVDDGDSSAGAEEGGGREIPNPPISRTYCSPLRRCLQTYSALCSSSFRPLPPPIVLEDLREIHLAEWQGRLRKDVALSDSKNWNVFKTRPKELRLRNGTFSPVADCWERGRKNWEVIRAEARENEDEVVFVMCHGAMGQGMLLNAIGLDIDAYGKTKKFALDNCDCVEVQWYDGEANARRWRRVWPKEGGWEECGATRRMFGEGLGCER